MRGVEHKWRAGIEIYLGDSNNYLLQPLRVGFESHAARANLRTRSMTEAA